LGKLNKPVEISVPDLQPTGHRRISTPVFNGAGSHVMTDINEVSDSDAVESSKDQHRTRSISDIETADAAT
jgi:hypothetical protein